MKRKKSTAKNKKLSIAHLHWGFPPIIGGVETHLTILCPMLARKGHNVTLLTSSVQGLPETETVNGFTVMRSPIMDLNWLYKRGLSGIEEEVESVFKNFIEMAKPDIIHAHNMHYFSITHAGILANLARKKGIPLILTAHNVWGDPLFLSIMRKIKWTHIIAVSHFIKKELIGIGIKHTKITTVHHGIDQNIYRPGINPSRIWRRYPLLKGKPVVFHPARMGLAKGCDVSVKAFRLVVEKVPDAVLALAGTANIIDWGATQKKDIAYIVELVDFFKLRRNTLMDVYALKDMPYLYAASSVCIYPSSDPEPFGLTMLESMASGKPIIVTNTGGMPEIIDDGVNGFVIPVRDFEELANRIVQLLTDRELRTRLGMTGRQMVEHQFTGEIMTENTLQVYRKFL